MVSCPWRGQAQARGQLHVSGSNCGRGKNSGALNEAAAILGLTIRRPLAEMWLNGATARVFIVATFIAFVCSGTAEFVVFMEMGGNVSQEQEELSAIWSILTLCDVLKVLIN